MPRACWRGVRNAWSGGESGRARRAFAPQPGGASRAFRCCPCRVGRCGMQLIGPGFWFGTGGCRKPSTWSLSGRLRDWPALAQVPAGGCRPATLAGLTGKPRQRRAGRSSPATCATCGRFAACAADPTPDPPATPHYSGGNEGKDLFDRPFLIRCSLEPLFWWAIAMTRFHEQAQFFNQLAWRKRPMRWSCRRAALTSHPFARGVPTASEPCGR